MTEPLLDAFVDSEPPPAPVVDRSTLENYATCPARGLLIERRAVTTGSELTDVGDEVHRILSDAVKARHLDAAGPKELREQIEDAAAKSRPDVQPEVLAATQRSYPIVSLLCYHGEGERAPEDILRYDGGADAHSGQLAADMEVRGAHDVDSAMCTIRLTAELDLVMAGASAEELEVYDWKSGWKHWTATDVRDSFQFQFYAWLVFRNYKSVNRVRVSVVLARDGTMTSPVEFDRRQMYVIGQRLLSAARVYLQFHAAGGPDDVPAWPAPSKCGTCDALRECLVSHTEARDMKDPEAALRQLVVLQETVERQEAMFANAVRAQGKDFDFGDCCFGTEAPKQSRAVACKLYQRKGGK